MRPILQVVTDTDRRGAQVFACDLERALSSLGRDVRTVALAPGSVGGLEMPVLGSTRLGPATLRGLRRAARDSGVVVAHGSTTLPACAASLAGTGRPFVYRQISEVTFWTGTWPRRQRVRTALARAARVVALWNGSADTVANRFGYPRHHIEVIPNAVPGERFAPPAADEVASARRALGLDEASSVVVYIGALVQEKGVDLAIDAIAPLPGVVLVVAGDGPERSALEARAAASAPGRVLFAGSVADARVPLAAADVVALVSRGGDSMPAVLMEAGLMGVPAISTPVEAIPEVVLDGSSGFIVPAGAEPVREAIERLTRNPELRREFGAAAAAHCRANYTMDVVASRWCRVLDAVGAVATG